MLFVPCHLRPPVNAHALQEESSKLPANPSREVRKKFILTIIRVLMVGQMHSAYMLRIC